MSGLSRRGLMGGAAVLTPAAATGTAAPAPDATFLAHLAAFDALQREVEGALAAWPDADPEPQHVRAALGPLWERQREAVNNMVTTGCTTWPARQRLAEVLRTMGHRERPDNPEEADENRLVSLLLRSMVGVIGGAA